MKDRGGASKDALLIRNVVEHMTALGDRMNEFNPTCTVMSLWPEHMEAIQRNPNIAARCGIVVSERGPPRWRGFTLVAATSRAPQLARNTSTNHEASGGGPSVLPT
jgi:hypothetical protein